MLEFLKDYPAIGGICIATIFSALGYFGKSIIELILEKRRKKTEQKEFLWKEKIEAAKKASEYYFENLSYLKLVKQNFETQLNGENYSPVLNDSFQSHLTLISDRIKNPENFQHHHIRIFYDIDESDLDQIDEESFIIIQKMDMLVILESDDEESIREKQNQMKILNSQLKDNFEKTASIYKSLLDKIRKDLSSIVD